MCTNTFVSYDVGLVEPFSSIAAAFWIYNNILHYSCFLLLRFNKLNDIWYKE